MVWRERHQRAFFISQAFVRNFVFQVVGSCSMEAPTLILEKWLSLSHLTFSVWEEIEREMDSRDGLAVKST